jgi:hypothetical protein
VNEKTRAGEIRQPSVEFYKNALGHILTGKTWYGGVPKQEKNGSCMGNSHISPLLTKKASSPLYCGKQETRTKKHNEE